MTRSATVLVGAEGAGLAEHGVDQGGLAVVDVGDDGDVAEIGALHGAVLKVGKGGGRAATGLTRVPVPALASRTGSPPRRSPAAVLLHPLADELPPGLQVAVAHALDVGRRRPSEARMPSRSTACCAGVDADLGRDALPVAGW